MTASTSWNFVRGSLGIRCFKGVGVPSFYWDLVFYTWTGWWIVFVFFQLYNSDLFLFWTKYLRSSSYNSYKNCPQKKVKGTPLERWNICVNFGFARLIWRPFIRSTEKRGRIHFFEECSLHIYGFTNVLKINILTNTNINITINTIVTDTLTRNLSISFYSGILFLWLLPTMLPDAIATPYQHSWWIDNTNRFNTLVPLATAFFLRTLMQHNYCNTPKK
jgi:hypothetical protein